MVHFPFSEHLTEIGRLAGHALFYGVNRDILGDRQPFEVFISITLSYYRQAHSARHHSEVSLSDARKVSRG